METIEQVKQSFDLILSKFDENNNLLTDISSIKDLIQLILQSNDKYLSETDFINHRLFIFLRDCYLNFLQQWRHGAQFDETISYIFETIPNVFLKILNHNTDKNITILKELILYKPILEELNKCLEEIAINGRYLKDPQIKSLDNIFRAIQRLERNHSENKLDPLLTKLFDNIVKCICSSSFINIFIHSSTQENDDLGQKFLLHTCVDYIYSHAIDQQHKQYLLDIRQSILQSFSQWLTQQSSSFRLWNSRMSVILRQICFILTLSIQNNRYQLLDREILDYYSQLIDSFINILYSIFQIEDLINNKLAQSLLATITPNLYTMILSNQLEKYLKTKHITLIILKLIEFDNDEIQLNAFRILSIILTEQDTKNNLNSTNIINLFIKSLIKTIDNQNQIFRFSNLLHCLKYIISYDPIKDEFIKQNGLLLILRCITETKFKTFQIQQPSLEIILALTFNQEAYRQLKENINYIKLLIHSPHQSILRVIDCILWRLEKQEENLLKSKNSSQIYQYDIMISYSQSNKDLIYQIYEQLLKDNFRIWIDRDENFGTTMTTKASIMDQSQYILICISDEYKQNSYCRSEAYYAYESQYKIIPLILTSNLHPDGWLIDITNGKIYIDFVKFDFDLAYNTLKSEINRDDLFSIIHPISFSKIDSTSSIRIELPKNEYPLSLVKIESTPSPRSEVSKIEYQSNIKQWTKDQVKSFLIENQFDCLIPIICEMNGNLLYDLYTMCNDNRESMFHTLKNEILILDKNSRPLTLLIYLRFLQEIQNYIF